MLNGGVISYASKKLKIVASSSCEAEYSAAMDSLLPWSQGESFLAISSGFSQRMTTTSFRTVAKPVQYFGLQKINPLGPRVGQVRHEHEVPHYEEAHYASHAEL